MSPSEHHLGEKEKFDVPWTSKQAERDRTNSLGEQETKDETAHGFWKDEAKPPSSTVLWPDAKYRVKGHQLEYSYHSLQQTVTTQSLQKSPCGCCLCWLKNICAAGVRASVGLSDFLIFFWTDFDTSFNLWGVPMIMTSEPQQPGPTGVGEGTRTCEGRMRGEKNA